MYVGEKKKEMRDYDLRQSVSLAFTFIHSYVLTKGDAQWA